MMKILLGLAMVLAAAPLKAAELQFAESVPEGTVYGSTLAARPQAVWLEMIAASSKTLDMEQFYIADEKGRALEPVIAAVKAAAARGVKVRFIADSKMMEETGKTLPALKAAGVDARVIDFKKIGGGIQHSKFFVSDGREVYVGSQNFDWRSLTQVHEIGLRIKSARAAADFGLVFEGDWAAAGGAGTKRMFPKKRRMSVTAASPEKATLNGAGVSYSLAFSPEPVIPAGADSEIRELLAAIAAAKRSIDGQVMTCSLAEHGSARWAELDSALRNAAARGVKVRLVFADWAMGGKSDRDIKALARTDNITVKISSLPEAPSGFIPYARVEHCKYMVLDGETSYVTTNNWGPGYFLTTRGAAVFIRGAAGAAALEDIFSRTWDGPYVQPVDPLKEYQPVKRS